MQERAAYPLLLGLGALDATGYSVIVPVLPAIADGTGAGPATVGLLVASFPAGMILGFALAGWLVRRRGARVLLTGSLVLVAVGAAGFILGDSLAVYFPARLLMGMASGGLWIGVIFDTIDRWPGQEYVCMSRVYAAYAVGGLIGPVLAVFDGVHGPFLAYLVLLLLALPLVVLVGEPTRRRELMADRTALRTRGFWVASAGILFAVLALGVLEGVLPLHFAERLGQTEIAGLYVGTSIVVAVSASAAAGARPRPLVLAAVLLVVAGISLAGIAAHVPAWLLALLLAGVGIGIANTASLGAARRGCPGGADRDRDGRLVADRDHRIPARSARWRHRRRGPRLRVRGARAGGRGRARRRAAALTGPRRALVIEWPACTRRRSS